MPAKFFIEIEGDIIELPANLVQYARGRGVCPGLFAHALLLNIVGELLKNEGPPPATSPVGG